MSYHILVHEDDFPLIDNTGVWPWDVLITPFHGRLNPDQIYSSENSTPSRPHSPGSRGPPVPPCFPLIILIGAGGEADALA